MSIININENNKYFLVKGNLHPLYLLSGNSGKLYYFNSLRGLWIHEDFIPSWIHDFEITKKEAIKYIQKMCMVMELLK